MSGVKEFLVGLLLGAFVVGSPAFAHHNHYYDPVRNYDPYWYAYDDTCCYSSALFDDRMNDAISNPAPPYGTLNWSKVANIGGTRYWARSTGQNVGGHHRRNMATYDYDCYFDWWQPGLSRHYRYHPAPGCSGQGGDTWLAITEFAVNTGTYPYSLLNVHVYFDPGEPWYEGTGQLTPPEQCGVLCRSDLWATMEHELGHGLALLGDMDEDDPYQSCPVNQDTRATMCWVQYGTWRQRSPEVEDTLSMRFNWY